MLALAGHRAHPPGHHRAGAAASQCVGHLPSRCVEVRKTLVDCLLVDRIDHRAHCIIVCTLCNEMIQMHLRLLYRSALRRDPFPEVSSPLRLRAHTYSFRMHHDGDLPSRVLEALLLSIVSGEWVRESWLSVSTLEYAKQYTTITCLCLH